MGLGNSRKVIIVVSGQHQVEAALKIGSDLSGAGNKVLFLTQDHLRLPIQCNARSLSYYRDSGNISFRGCYEDLHRLIAVLSGSLVGAAGTVRDLTRFEGDSLWDLSSVDLFYKIIPLVIEINVINETSRVESPDEVMIFSGKKNNLDYLCRQFFTNKGVPVRIYGGKGGKGFSEGDKFFKFSFLFMQAKRCKRFILSAHLHFSNLIRALTNGPLKPKVIFFTTEERFAETQLPVVKCFDKKDRLVVNAIFPGSRAKLKKDGIFFIEFYGCLLYPFFRGSNVTAFLKKAWQAIDGCTEFHGRVIYKDVPLWELLRGEFYRLFFCDFEHKIYRLKAIKQLIDSYSPRVIVVSDNLADIIYSAKKNNVPVAAMQSSSIEEFIEYGTVSADRITVDGDYWKAQLVKTGIPASKITVTGPPRFDNFFNNGRQDISMIKKRLYESMSFGTEKKLVIFAGCHVVPSAGLFESQYRDFVRGVFNCFRDIEEVQLLVKMHPCDFNFQIYKEIAQEAGLHNISVVKDTDKWDLLLSCDLLITYLSMMSYEAIILDRPVICLQNLSKFGIGILSEDLWRLKESKAAVCINSFSELKGAVHDVLYNEDFVKKLRESRKGYVEAYLNNLGNASAYVKEGIIELMGRE